MKLVLLPGLDGTGELFESFLESYDGETQTIQFPEEDLQGYVNLACRVKKELPKTNFVLLSESFSGGLVEHILEAEGLKGVIFVASFISSPNKPMLFLAGLIPKKLATYVPGSRLVAKLLFFGHEANETLYRKFVAIIRKTSSRCLNQRIRSIRALRYNGPSKVQVPCVYIRPNHDSLVGHQKVKEIEAVFENFKCYYLNGPHFIIQAKPKETAELIKSAVKHITSVAI